MKPSPPLLAAIGRLHAGLVFGRRVHVLSREIARLLPPGRLVDVGCGSGSIAEAVRRVRPDVFPEGFDVLVRPGAAIPVREFDGRRLPLADGEAAAALVVDVLHHADDPAALLAECARVAPVVIVKDHVAASRRDERLLAFMDWVGNRPHGVVLPYNYFSPRSWGEACRRAGLVETVRGNVADLYPWPFSVAFGGELHFLARLETGSGLTN